MHLTAQRDGNNLDVELAGTWRGTDLPAIDAELAGVSLAGVNALRIAIPESLDLDLAGAWTLRQWMKAAEKSGARVELTGREFRLLELLLANPGRVLGKDVLLDRLCGREGAVGPNAIELCVSRLRRKLDGVDAVHGADDAGDFPRLIALQMADQMPANV